MVDDEQRKLVSKIPTATTRHLMMTKCYVFHMTTCDSGDIGSNQHSVTSVFAAAASAKVRSRYVSFHRLTILLQASLRYHLRFAVLAGANAD